MTTEDADLPHPSSPAVSSPPDWREDGDVTADALAAAHNEIIVLRQALEREQEARRQAEAQQLLVAQDFRAMYRKTLTLAGQLDQAYLETITALAKAVEARDLHTGNHVERVRRYSVYIAEHLGISGDERRSLEFGAVLHDVGKIGIPDSILSKRGPLDATEWQIMRRHPEIGRDVLASIAFLGPALDAVACHHERWDGLGYPFGLEGHAIPLAGRIVCVADAYDAMTTNRSYQAKRTVDDALAEIARGRGTQFDPDVADVLLNHPPTFLYHVA
ncbi:MAG: HD-GYP domain-containing protein [Chloroflexota bacterium]